VRLTSSPLLMISLCPALPDLCSAHQLVICDLH
jgi:hypothetical protein